MTDDRGVPRIAYSVVVPTHDRAHPLVQTIDSVLGAASGRDDVEIIVADDGCSDASAALVAAIRSETEIIYIRQPDRGFRADHELVHDRLPELVAAQALAASAETLTIARAALGSDILLIGAAELPFTPLLASPSAE